MKSSPIISLCLLGGITYLGIVGGGLENLEEYLSLGKEVEQAKAKLTSTTDSVYSLASSQHSLDTVDKFVIEDIIKASGSSINKIKLLTMTNPVKVISESDKIDEIPDGGYYEFEVTSPDINLLLKKLDDNAIVCDVSIIEISNKVFIKVLTGGAFK